MSFSLGLPHPLGLYGDWSVTAIGSISARGHTTSEVEAEKSSSRRNSKRSVILSDERRHVVVIVIIGTGHGSDFQDLARGTLVPSTRFTKCSVLALAVSWVTLLVTASNDTVRM
jgi:hypothetical protein